MTITVILQILSLVAGVAGALFGYVRHQQAKATQATATARVSELEKDEAKADAAAATARVDAVAVRQQVETQNAAKSPQEVQREMDQWRM
ncbi:hypothetical protein [Herbaspirillum sp.]|uniref:hypothetical protein n=1 Tax=Herbaspirillum sp. TaxID=1890675 RepID=UPI000C09014D|nr:hypothetical protein [Herbaspirillum sp.]MAF05569.1 hypothetical protein [Herbaspirillum sp.]MBO17761.1 hypothetical protein [Herbaspirillum sp.]|tara:strand:- start:2321 stop:2590 length:270 start_codon:yes stop_codon:yes gene_type:complete